MRTMRQKIQLELALAPVAKGEARAAVAEGTEVRVARVDSERPAAQARARSSFARLDRINPSNRRVRTRTHGGVGGAEPQGSPLSRLCTRSMARSAGRRNRRPNPERKSEQSVSGKVRFASIAGLSRSLCQTRVVSPRGRVCRTLKAKSRLRNTNHKYDSCSRSSRCPIRTCHLADISVRL